MNDNIITQIGALALSTTIEKLEFLEELDLGDCLLRNKGGLHLSNAIKASKSILNVCLLIRLFLMVIEIEHWVQ